MSDNLRCMNIRQLRKPCLRTGGEEVGATRKEHHRCFIRISQPVSDEQVTAFVTGYHEWRFEVRMRCRLIQVRVDKDWLTPLTKIARTSQTCKKQLSNLICRESVFKSTCFGKSHPACVRTRQ